MDLKAQAKIMEKERNKPENKFCADWDTLGPQWISIKYGVFIWLRCSGKKLIVHSVSNRIQLARFLSSSIFNLIQYRNSQKFGNSFDICSFKCVGCSKSRGYSAVPDIK